MTERLLEAKSLVKQFRGVRAIDGVTLTVDTGEIVGLIGPNGSGKSTMINLISGALRPTHGAITFAGRRTSGLAPYRVARSGVGRTFQQIRLFTSLSIRENVEFGFIAKGGSLKAARIDHLLELLSLSHLQGDRAGALSYGTQRRVEIARALAGSPKLLLLDEPAAGMNDDESSDLRETIRLVHHELDCSILIVEHDIDLMVRLCDRLHVLAGGSTVAEGSPEQVRNDPAVIAAYFGQSSQNAPEPQMSDHQQLKSKEKK